MSNYSKATNFATKDTLSTGNPSKIVKGTELDTEFNAIASAITTKIETSDLTALSGRVIQVVQSTSTSTATTSANASYVTTGHTATITPTSATSKILVMCTFTADNSKEYDSGFTVYRNSTTNIAGTNTNPVHFGYVGGTAYNLIAPISLQYVDSPSATSATTYTVYMLNPGSPSTLTYNVGQGNGSQTGLATIILMEITQ